MYLAQKARNVLRAVLQAHGNTNLKKRLWNHEFANGRWNCLDSGIGDCVYPYVEKYANNGGILDLGCGSGSTGTELNETTYRHYTGIDVSDVALEKARRKTTESGRAGRNHYVPGDIFSYVPARQYPVILFKDSIYYVPRGKIDVMLNRYSKYLTERGVFVVKMSGSDKFKTITDTIERNFEVVEKYRADQPEALVIVFQPRCRRERRNAPLATHAVG